LNNVKELWIYDNKLCGLSANFLKIINKLRIDDSSYDINNINIDNEFLIFNWLKKNITNLPFNTKEIWLNKNIMDYNIKLPFGCIIKYY